MKAPFPEIELIPTGGVSLKTAGDFIRAGSSAIGIGAELVDLQALRSGNMALLKERAGQFITIVREARESA